MNAVFAACGRSGSSSVRADEDRELRSLGVGDEPLVTVDHPFVAVLNRRGLDQRRVAAGNLGFGHRETAHRRAFAQRARYFSFCSSVPQCSSVCMLPSSGAWQFNTHGP